MGNITDMIRETALSIMPETAKVILFGSRARGDWRKESDWDILVLLDKDHISDSDHELYSYPFWELGWETDEMIHPIIYTFDDWKARKGTEFYNNVTSEGIQIC